MSDPEPTIRPGFEIEHFSGLTPSEREGVVALVNAGLTGAEAREIVKDPNIGYVRAGAFVGLLKLGLGWREIRDNFREYKYAFDIATDNDGPYRKLSSASELRRVAKLIRQGQTATQAIISARQGGGCMVVLAAWIAAGVSLGMAGWLVW